MIRFLSTCAVEALGLAIGIAGAASVYWLGELLRAAGVGR